MKDKMRQVETQDLQRLSLFQKSKIQPEESVLFTLDGMVWIVIIGVLLVNAVTVNTKVFLSLL